MSVYKCPFPECDHVGEVFTNAHCEIAHGMSKKDVIKKYGQPTWFSSKKYEYYPSKIKAKYSDENEN